MDKLPHIKVIRTHYEDFGIGDPGWNARYTLTDTNTGAALEVRGPNTNGCTWYGDVTGLPFSNPATAFRYARQHVEGVRS